MCVCVCVCVHGETKRPSYVSQQKNGTWASHSCCWLPSASSTADLVSRNTKDFLGIWRVMFPERGRGLFVCGSDLSTGEGGEEDRKKLYIILSGGSN